MTIDEARDHIGSAVMYRPFGKPPEEGVITSVSDSYVFVKYQHQHPSANSIATPADALVLAY